VVRNYCRPQPKTGQARAGPALQKIGKLGRGTGENGGVAGVLAAGEVVEALLAVGCRTPAVVEEDHKVREDVHRVIASTSGRLMVPDLADDLGRLRRCVRRHEADIGVT